MTTMSDDGDRTCPLCAEEMDITDQQLKPCKCGYEICVWCWHHIMEMAEKEGSEGRCPACRTSYDKQRIVGMAANCKRMVAEISAEKKQKSQKTKNKCPSTIEDRKHLSSVRVVQKNLVYIMGMPSNLSDESILERKEYFGQYGKVLKVSVSRQAGTTPQQAANSNTFSVYITYAREEEAVRCIQSVHNFVLEGKPLRACFGTTKYCYTWLRNMTCSNPDCLYLHDIGSQEDSFTKDEIISAYTRSRVPQIPSNNLQPRAGIFLPPPVDDLYNDSTAATKQSMKSSFSNTSNVVRSSPIDTSGTRSTVLPAAASWGLCSSNCRSPSPSVTNLQQNPVKQKTEVLNSPSSSTIISSTKPNSAWHDEVDTTQKVPEGSTIGNTDKCKLLEPLKHGNGRDHPTQVANGSGSALDVYHNSGSAWDDDITVAKIPNGKRTLHANGRSRSTNTTFVLNSPEKDILDEAHHSAWDDDTFLTSNMMGEGRIVQYNDNVRSLKILEPGVGLSRSVLDVTSKYLPDAIHTSKVSISCSSVQPSSQQYDPGSQGSSSIVSTDPVNIIFSKDAASTCLDKNHKITQAGVAVNGNTESLCTGLSSVTLDANLGVDHNNIGQEESTSTDRHSVRKLENLNARLHQHHPEIGAECSTFVSVNGASALPPANVSEEFHDWRKELQEEVLSSSGNVNEDALATSDDQIYRLSDGATNLSSCSSYKTNSSNISNQLTCSFQNGDGSDKRLLGNGVSRIMEAKLNRDNDSLFLNEHKEQMPKPEQVFEYPYSSCIDKELCSSGFDKLSNIKRTATVDTEEDNIVSKMLSSDFDPWDNSWSSANDFAKLIAQMNKEEGPKQSSSWKLQNTNQSRFSFARQEHQANPGDIPYRDAGLGQQVSSNQEFYGNSFGNAHSVGNSAPANAFGSSNSRISSDSNAGVIRTKISAPPGFSVPNRSPPPGFPSSDRYDQAFSTSSDTQVLGSSLQNHFQVHSTSNVGDVEFIDPAILAVGKGTLPLGVNNTGIGSRSAFQPQFSTTDSDARIQLLMQQSISASQDPRITHHIGDRFFQFDGYTASRFSAQNPNLSPFSQISSHQQPSHILSSQWNGWNDMQIGNDMGVPAVLRSDRFGPHNYFPANEEPKFHLPSSSDIYNRAFGM